MPVVDLLDLDRGRTQSNRNGTLLNLINPRSINAGLLHPFAEYTDSGASVKRYSQIPQ